jgi:hypothetical protein
MGMVETEAPAPLNHLRKHLCVSQRNGQAIIKGIVVPVRDTLKKRNIMYVSASGDRQRAKVKILNSKGIANQTSLESSVAYDSPVLCRENCMQTACTK